MLNLKKKKSKKFFKKKYNNCKNIPNIETIAKFNIFSTFNNTILTITDYKGNTIFWSTASSSGFKGFKKSTSQAAQIAGEKMGRLTIKKGFNNASIHINGMGPGRDFCIRGIYNSGINIIFIEDITSIPHNGCKLKKIKRN